jgi:hypothetical protein
MLCLFKRLIFIFFVHINPLSTHNIIDNNHTTSYEYIIADNIT